MSRREPAGCCRVARWRRSVGLFGVGLLLLPVGSLLADDRGRELLFYSCVNDLGRRDITLFANGTVRLREGLYEGEVLHLAELGRDELGETAARLKPDEALHAPSIEHRSGPVAGRFVESCELRLELPDVDVEHYRFTRWDVPPLRVAQLIRVAEELAATARPPALVSRLPADYEPLRGDILQTAEGQRFEVLGTTSDGKAVELVGIGSPVRIYIAIDDLGSSFAELEERR